MPSPSGSRAEAVLTSAILRGSLESFASGAKFARRDVGALGESLGERFTYNAAKPDIEDLAARARIGASHWTRDWLERSERKQAEGAAEHAARREAAKEVDYRLDRIAATETPNSFNEARRESVRASVDKEAAKEANLVRVWRAELDACPRCASYDGDIAPLHGSYPSGEEPGSAHPRCRCSEDIRVE